MDPLVLATLLLVSVTLFLVVATLVLALGEAMGRAAERRAEVEVLVRPWERGGGGHLYLEVRVQNFGPANAHDLKMDVQLQTADGTGIVQATHGIREGLLPVGRHWTFLPRPSPGMTLGQMADAAYAAVISWSWIDERRLLPFGTKRQVRHLKADIGTVKADYIEGRALAEERLLDYARDLRDDIKRLTAIAEQEHTDLTYRRMLAEPASDEPPAEPVTASPSLPRRNRRPTKAE